MSSVESDSSSDDSTSYGSILGAADSAKEDIFVRRCWLVRRNLAVEFFKEALQRRGRTSRSVSGSSGRLLRQLGDAPYNVFRTRVVSTLTPASRRRLDAAVAFLEQAWGEQLLPNDQEFVRALGTAADPGLSSIQQRFQLFFHRAATDSGISSSHARMVLEVIRCSSEYALCQPSVEFLVRSLPARQRRLLLEWLEAARL